MFGHSNLFEEQAVLKNLAQDHSIKEADKGESIEILNRTMNQKFLISYRITIIILLIVIPHNIMNVIHMSVTTSG